LTPLPTEEKVQPESHPVLVVAEEPVQHVAAAVVETVDGFEVVVSKRHKRASMRCRCQKTFFSVADVANKLECFVTGKVFLGKTKICKKYHEPYLKCNTSGLYYKHMMIVNYASSIVNKLKALLTGDARVIIYNRHVFIVQATRREILD